MGAVQACEEELNLRERRQVASGREGARVGRGQAEAVRALHRGRHLELIVVRHQRVGGQRGGPGGGVVADRADDDRPRVCADELVVGRVQRGVRVGRVALSLSPSAYRFRSVRSRGIAGVLMAHPYETVPG